MPSPPITNFFANPVARFLLSGELRHRLLRHGLLVGIIGFQFVASASGGPINLAWTLGINGGLFVLMLLLVYANLYGLVPRLLWPGRVVGYGLALGALVTIFWLYFVFSMWLLPPQLRTANQPESLTVVSFLDTVLLPLIFVGATTGLKVFQRWVADARRLAELEAQGLRAELAQLKSQINPHFLFNTLNNLEVLTRQDPERASQLLFALSDLLRYQLYDGNRDTVPLTRDIEHLRQVLLLEQVRREQFDFVLAVGPAIRGQLVAPYLFIPFVENAIKHSATAAGPSHVRLRFEAENGQLMFWAENSRPAQPAYSAAHPPGGLGLKNSVRRLELLYPARHELTFSSTETLFSVKLTLHL